MRNQPIPTPLLNGFNYYIKMMKENFPRLLFSLRGDTKWFQHLYLYVLILILCAIYWAGFNGRRLTDWSAYLRYLIPSGKYLYRKYFTFFFFNEIYIPDFRIALYKYVYLSLSQLPLYMINSWRILLLTRGNSLKEGSLPSTLNLIVIWKPVMHRNHLY